jgi:hypothetical protein
MMLDHSKTFEVNGDDKGFLVIPTHSKTASLRLVNSANGFFGLGLWFWLEASCHKSRQTIFFDFFREIRDSILDSGRVEAQEGDFEQSGF